MTKAGQEKETIGIMPCPNCNHDTEHSLIHGQKAPGSDEVQGDATVRCSECNLVYVAKITNAPPVMVRVIVSEGPKSRQEKVQFESGEMISVDSEMNLLGHRMMVTGIEVGLKRVRKSRAFKIETIWAKVFDKVMVKVGVNLNTMTRSFEIEALPDQEFVLGQEISLPVGVVKIHGIKTSERMIRKGGSEARNIVRIFAKPYHPLPPPERAYGRFAAKPYTRSPGASPRREGGYESRPRPSYGSDPDREPPPYSSEPRRQYAPAREPRPDSRFPASDGRRDGERRDGPRTEYRPRPYGSTDGRPQSRPYGDRPGPTSRDGPRPFSRDGPRAGPRSDSRTEPRGDSRRSPRPPPRREYRPREGPRDGPREGGDGPRGPPRERRPYSGRDARPTGGAGYRGKPAGARPFSRGPPRSDRPTGSRPRPSHGSDRDESERGKQRKPRVR